MSDFWFERRLTLFLDWLSSSGDRELTLAMASVRKYVVCIFSLSLFMTTTILFERNPVTFSNSSLKKVKKFFKSALEHGDNVTTYARRTQNNANPCKPTQRIVFIKTHKTASSTTNSIIQRFGFTRGLTFALPKRSHIFDERILFSREMLLKPAPSYGKGDHFSVIASHLRYNRPELEEVVPNATYITILRDPVKKFESTFGYYNYATLFNLTSSINPLEKFINSPDKYRYLNMTDNVKLRNQLRNGMMYNLGFDHKFDDDISTIDKMIQRLDRELNLVLITDYYEESLVLLKNVLCWEIQDILYISKGLRSDKRRYEISQSVARKIEKWNEADVQLFNHFNKTFWEKIKSYGSGFYGDLQEFRRRQQEFYEECVDSGKTGVMQGREDILVMKANASQECKIAFLRDVSFHAILRREALGNSTKYIFLNETEARKVNLSDILKHQK
ncbi:galactosylceramide sulfotransferase-like [Ptychodera flava]|uniref:galactosylceramide sulfotransferase-like n=1 Tax=Ptychodera flava TaxID=63121 RepID=UPI00396A19B3